MVLTARRGTASRSLKRPPARQPHPTRSRGPGGFLGLLCPRGFRWLAVLSPDDYTPKPDTLPP